MRKPAAKAAEWVSAATRLPLIAVPLFAAVGWEAAGAAGLLWALLCVFLTSGLSLLYLLRLTRTGRVRDPRRIPQAERVGPLRVVAGLHAGAFALVWLAGGPTPLVAALLSYALATAAFAVLAPIVNLSLHAAGIAGAAVCLASVFGAWGAPAFVLIPLVWWARTALGRHTAAELALGTAVGGGFTVLAFGLVG